MLKLALWFSLCAAVAGAQTPVSIQVDLNKPVGAYTPITNWYGYDELNYTTTANGKALLRELHDTSPQPVYIRAHHMLTSGDGVPQLKWSSTNIYTVGADGKPVYDFKIIDGVFDTYKQMGVRPMVELGFMPEDLTSGKPPYFRPYPHTTDGSVQFPPKDYGAWGELCRKLVEHLVTRYGRVEVDKWYFEVWNEPDIFYWRATEAEYLKLYDYAVAGVRSALPTAKVGGPAVTSPRGAHTQMYLDTFLKHVANDKSAADGKTVPMDFISFHVKGDPRIIQGHDRMGLDKELLAADRGFNIIAGYPQFIKLPIILSEADPEGCAACSARENPANAYRNGTLFPVYTAAAIKGLFELQDRYKVNLISMLTWSFEFEGKDYFQGFRTLATNGVDKPIMNVFRMAGKMSGQRVATTSTGQISLDDIMKSGVRTNPDIDAFATRDAHQAAVMLWNYQDDDAPGESAPVEVKIDGLPASVHRAKLTHFRIDDTHSNAYTVWQGMGAPQQPTAAQQAELKKAGLLQTLDAPSTVNVKNGSITLPFSMPRHATSLLVVSW